MVNTMHTSFIGLFFHFQPTVQTLLHVCVWDECTLYDQECQIGWPLAHSAPLDEWNYKKCLSYTFLSNEVREGGGILIMKVAYNSVLDFGNFGGAGPI